MSGLHGRLVQGALVGVLGLALGACGDDLTARPFVDASAEDAGADAGRGADAGAPWDGGKGPGGFAIVALPDTQYYAESYPNIFEGQVRWVLDNRAARKIAFVVHEGDIVNIDQESEWRVAATALHKLDGVIPYALAAGNHDYINYGVVDRMTMMNRYFPVAGFASQPGWLGTWEDDRIENNAQLLPLGGREWLVLSLEFGPRDGALAWAAAMLEAYPDTPALIVTHAYLYADGTRYDHVTRTDQLWNPYSYWYGPSSPPPGVCNDGQEMWDKLIATHENVRFVVSGHVFNTTTGEAAAVLSTTRPSGTVVHQIVANYQESGGQATGYLRLMTFDDEAHALRVETYSPNLDRWRHDAANEFVLPLP